MKKMMIASLAAAGALFAVENQAHAGATLDAVKKKGFVQCGISDGLPPTVNLPVLMWMFVVALPLPYSAMTRK